MGSHVTCMDGLVEKRVRLTTGDPNEGSLEEKSRFSSLSVAFATLVILERFLHHNTAPTRNFPSAISGSRLAA